MGVGTCHDDSAFVAEGRAEVVVEPGRKQGRGSEEAFGNANISAKWERYRAGVLTDRFTAMRW